MTDQLDQPPAQDPAPARPNAPQSGWTTPGAPAASPPGAAGLVYADVPNRAIAYIIDAIILFIINVVIGLIVYPIMGAAGSSLLSATGTVNTGAILLVTLLGLVVNGVYFIYTWTSMRASPGQKMLGMQVGNASNGATLTQPQAIRRWIFLGAPFGLASALNPLPAIGILIGLAGLVYLIYLLISTAQSPTKQGFHDKQADTIVVKAARTVG